VEDINSFTAFGGDADIWFADTDTSDVAVVSRQDDLEAAVKEHIQQAPEGALRRPMADRRVHAPGACNHPMEHFVYFSDGLTVSLGDAETPASFTSRLAARNGVNARKFCLDWDLRFQPVVDGDEKTIAVIAEMSGVDAAALLRHAFVRDELGYEYRNERLIRPSLRRTRLNVCPACLLDDIEGNPNLRPHLAAYGRATWLIEAVRTCQVHNMALSPIGSNSTAADLHDFAFHIRATLPDLPRMAMSALARRPGELEAYVFARLNGARRSQFLDDLPLFAAIRCCEVLGAIALFGRHANLKSPDDENWRIAGSRGFEIASGGSETIHGFLDRLMSEADSRSRRDGPGVTFGRLYTWLSTADVASTYEPVRAVVGKYVRANFPLAAGTMVLGTRVPRRILHSLRTLSLETGQHPKRLRKALRAAGVITDGQMTMSDHNVLFDAQAGSAAAMTEGISLSLPAVREYLNAPRAQVDLLVKHGFIRPRTSVAELGGYDKYAIDDLAAFLGKLRLGTRSVKEPTATKVTIPEAAKKACCSAADIVRMILDSKLPWVGRLRDVNGYLSVLVDVDDVKAAVRGDELSGLTLRKVCEVLQTHDVVVAALINNGYLASFRAANPVNRGLQTLVAPAELERFQKTYVSLYVLAKERKMHHLALKSELDAAGIQPAFDYKKVHARFYRRSEC
jgi:hypothetical protein